MTDTSKALSDQKSGLTSEAAQPYHRGHQSGRHWLTILNKFSNEDKHRSLVLQVTCIERRLQIETIRIGDDPDRADTLDYDAVSALALIVSDARYQARIVSDALPGVRDGERAPSVVSRRRGRKA